MDGVSGVFAVVSLAIQLVDSVQEARSFLKDIQNAPKELIRLEETLDQLNSVLNYVRNLLEQQFITSRLPGTPTFILHGLQDCEKKLQPLKKLVDDAKVSTNQRRRAYRAWASTKLASKKDDLQQLERQLRDAKSDLHFAVTGNLWQLQMQQLELTRVNFTETTKCYTSQNVQAGTVVTSHDREMEGCSPRPKLLVRKAYQETDEVWYSGVFGRVTVKKRAKHSTDPAYLEVFGSKALAEETSVTVVPSFMRRLLEMSLAYSLGKTSRSLNVYPVLPCYSPIMNMCRNGNMHGLQAVFSSGQMSPFVLDEVGNTLLHYAAGGSNVELCSWLLGLGVDPNRTNSHKITALGWTFNGSTCRSSAYIVDTIRLLAQTQELFSTLDLEECAFRYRGPPQGVELILSQQYELEDGPAQGVALGSAHHFATAVRNYGKGNTAWEPIIRKLIQKGVDIHDLVNQAFLIPDVDNAEPVQAYGTPLDELFRFWQDPSESKESANAWLHILSSEGIEVQAYLMEEVAIHSAQNQLTWTDMNWRCRQLCYETGESPSVWWEWCPSPLSRIPLVQAEYRQISFDLNDRELGILLPMSWQERWPFDHPKWSDDPRMWEASQSRYWGWVPSPERQRLDLLAQERAERRFTKRVRKLARGQERRTRSQIPGTWVEQWRCAIVTAEVSEFEADWIYVPA